MEANELPLAFNGAAVIDVDLTDALVRPGSWIASRRCAAFFRRARWRRMVFASGGPRISVRKDTFIRVGKHRFLRVVDAA